MDLFVIDLDDPHDRWEELYRTVERALTAPVADAEPGPAWPGLDLDPLELLHLAYWNGA
jgi:hypothetical protein